MIIIKITTQHKAKTNCNHLTVLRYNHCHQWAHATFPNQISSYIKTSKVHDYIETLQSNKLFHMKMIKYELGCYVFWYLNSTSM